MIGKDAKKIVDELGIAHSTEISGYFFYNAASNLIGDEKGKNIFKHLAKEELDHVRVITALFESIKSGIGWLGYEDAVNRGTPSVEKGLPIYPKDNELTERLKKNPTDINAINIGMEAEESAVGFYGSLLNLADSPVEKTVLTRLLEMEKGHLKVLRWEKESLVKTGFWCGEMEYSVEKESE
ncbi:MAG: ferritin family protein [Deltaproteobacteria bacterium]|nr:ferritin family protein [Deltaproteobacteria bacterium]